MAHLNRKCLACATKYSYCPNCVGADRLAPAWKAEFCSESCKDLWLTATRYNMSMLTKEEAKSVISALDLQPIDQYVECVQRDYKKIMAEEPKKRNRRKPIDEIIEIEFKVVVDEQEQPVEVAESHEVVIKKENE